MSRFHQAVAHGAQGVGLASAGKSEGQDVDALFGEVAVGQLVQLLPQGQVLSVHGLHQGQVSSRGSPGLVVQAEPAHSQEDALPRYR